MAEDPTPTPTVTPTEVIAPPPTPSITPTSTLTPTVTPSLEITLEVLQSLYPELANSLTLNPSQSALMLDPELRALEATYAHHARGGEFGYNVRRRLRNSGYNV